MNFDFKKFKAITYKLKTYKLNRGMTYVELIIVLSIFSVMSSIVLFNYGKFQAKVDIKNLANDIALKIVQSQKDAISGKLSTTQPTSRSWKPSYGVYFNSIENKSFIYFIDLEDPEQNGLYNTLSLCPSDIDECIDKINITKGNNISNLQVFYPIGTPNPPSENDLSIVFTRPSSGAVISSNGLKLTDFNYVQITVSSSDDSTKGYIKVYPSGRIQVN